MEIVLLSIVFLIIAIIAIYLYKSKYSSEKTISRKTGLESLGCMPLSSKYKGLMIENNPKANLMRYIKDLRNNIMKHADIKVISVISCDPGEGKSWIANNIAVAFARINKRVLLIDANLKNETEKNRIFHLEPSEGLSNFIRDNQKEENYIKQTQVPNLSIMQNGTITENSSELIKSKKINELIKNVKEMYDIVIIDGTSYYEDENCAILSQLVDANVLVIEKNKTKKDDIIQLKEEIEDNNGKILGFVLNKTNVKRGKYYNKKTRQSFGIYMENINTEDNKEEKNSTIESLDNFEKLQNEIKENIMIEDFINDIEVNFNLKIDNINKMTQQNNEKIMEQLEENRKIIDEEMYRLNYNRREDYRGYERFSQNIVNKISEIQENLNVQYHQIEEKIKNIEYNEQMENQNYQEEIEQIKNEIKNQNYQEQIEQIKNMMESQNYQEQIEKIKKSLRAKEIDEGKKNNIISLSKIFMENRKKNNGVFSIEESIKFEDLEKLATDVIYFDEKVDNKNKKVYSN